MSPPSPTALRLATVTAVVFLVAACAAVPRATPVEPEGQLSVLGPGPGFTPANLPDDWAIDGHNQSAMRQLAVIQKDGVPALKVVNGKDSFVIVRRTEASLLVTPFLSWAWSMAAYDGGSHPVRLVIGFSGGTPENGSGGNQTFRWLGSDLPPHDRALSLAWGESALQRGTLTETGPGRAVPRYTVRGGREQVGAWWLETLDLSDLYAQAWPADNRNRVRIVFIGIAAEGGRPSSEADISGVVLSR
jgi:hypothetical protein